MVAVMVLPMTLWVTDRPSAAVPRLMPSAPAALRILEVSEAETVSEPALMVVCGDDEDTPVSAPWPTSAVTVLWIAASVVEARPANWPVARPHPTVTPRMGAESRAETVNSPAGEVRYTLSMTAECDMDSVLSTSDSPTLFLPI